MFVSNFAIPLTDLKINIGLFLFSVTRNTDFRKVTPDGSSDAVEIKRVFGVHFYFYLTWPTP